MTKRSKTRRVGTRNEAKAAPTPVGASERKSLPLLTLEDFARTILQAEVKKLPPKFTRDDLAREIQTYLNLSMKTLRLKGKFPKMIQAVDIHRYFHKPHVGQNFEIIEEPDFKESAEPLLIDDNLSMLNELLQRMRQRAGELGITWNMAASVIAKVADELRPDQRPEGVRRGEFCERIIEELGRIRANKGAYKTFEDLELMYPTFEVIRIIRRSTFDEDDRELLASPNQWGRVVTYATGILSKYLNKSESTIAQNRKHFKKYNRLQMRART
jgi:hypothetical protein